MNGRAVVQMVVEVEFGGTDAARAAMNATRMIGTDAAFPPAVAGAVLQAMTARGYAAGWPSAWQIAAVNVVEVKRD